MDNGLRFPNQYDKIVLLFYPPMAGGKFLNNCLGLSDEYVFQDFQLAKKQFEGNFNLDDKLKYIDLHLDELKNINRWDDLNLGCVQLFGMCVNEWSISNYGNSLQFLSTNIDILTLSNLWISKVCHNIDVLKSWIELFPNAKIINFYNWSTLINQRKHKKIKNKMWSSARREDWPLTPPLNIEEFYHLPKNVITEIEKNFISIKNKLIFEEKYIEHWDNFTATLKQTNSNIYDWDVEWYSDADKFLQELKILYEKLGLTINWKDEQVLNYRQRWLDTIFSFN